MLAAIDSATLVGIEGRPVRVEVHVSTGLPGYQVVGLPDAAGRESRERVRAALLSSRLPWPLRRITVNLAPGTIRKAGAGLELAVALGVLVAFDDLAPECVAGIGVLGELGLDGSVRSVPGTLALVDALRAQGLGRVIVPAASAAEAALVTGIEVLPARDLASLRACLVGEASWPGVEAGDAREADAPEPDDPGDLAEVRGLPQARRALAACAGGGHHLLLVGPPGTGKTMLATRLPSIFPTLSAEHALEVTRIHSAAGVLAGGRLRTRAPFRSPHHTASTAALVGGGSRRPTPGEVTLAHRGALFLDELGEFAPATLDALRQPLEERRVHIARQGASLTFPSSFTLVACSNPCPCGRGAPCCTCTEGQRARYRRRLSGPLLDRFDLRLRLAAPLPQAEAGASSATTRELVAGAVDRQERRYAGRRWDRNAHLPAAAAAADTSFAAGARDALREVTLLRALSGRGVARVRRVARTLADLDDVPAVSAEHVAEAAGLREDVP